MQEIIQLLVGVFVLALGFPIGNWLSKSTREELSQGQKWFKLIILVSLIGGFLGLIARNDAIMFSFFFIAITTSRSIKIKIKIKYRNYLFFFFFFAFFFFGIYFTSFN